MTAGITKKSSGHPLLKINFMSHGTLESRDLQATRTFYEDVLGLEVIQTSPRSLLIRKGGRHTYAVVQVDHEKDQDMTMFNHNGLDVDSEEAVLEAYQLLQCIQEQYGIRKILKPHQQHGVFSFFLQDLDGNWWEILANPPGGYTSFFDDPQKDITDFTQQPD